MMIVTAPQQYGQVYRPEKDKRQPVEREVVVLVVDRLPGLVRDVLNKKPMFATKPMLSTAEKVPLARLVTELYLMMLRVVSLMNVLM